jgi:hypothetical protein
MTHRSLAIVAPFGAALALAMAPLVASVREGVTRQAPVTAGAAVTVSSTAAAPAGDDARGLVRHLRTVARTVIALYDSKYAEHPRVTPVHSLAEMPLNHLGLIVRYHDIRSGLPPVSSLQDVRGVLTWFTAEGLPNPAGYLRWLDSLADAGKRVVIIGALGALRDDAGVLVPLADVNRTLARLGWRHDGGWHTATAGVRYVRNDVALLDFERPLPTVVPPYATVRATAPDAHVALRVEMPSRGNTASDLVIVSPRGAFVAPGYAHFADQTGRREFRQWYLNPFEFFRAAFATDDVPKLDTATLSGRRLYYSHIDGDGWRNLTQIEPFRSQHVIAAQVVLDALIKFAPDLPVTVGAIVGDLDRSWMGTAESLAVAKDIYALPHVEAAIHTYSHPLDWGFFDDEARSTRVRRDRDDQSLRVRGPDIVHSGGTAKPRSYETRPFSVTTEIDEAAAFVNRLLPAGKRVGLVQWTGDTRPFRQVLLHTRRAGLENINGGDTRFDREFPSAAWVSPLAERVGGELQVYASNSNENTYTDLWRDRFFGFSFLSKTVQNTGAPRRLKPFNLYYHMYSGERLSSLNAVLANLAFARSLSIAPIETSRFSRIVQGFFSATLEQEGPLAWRVRNRGALQTVRFETAQKTAVDFERSRGVVGQRRELGSLFAALDEAVDAPLVVLKAVAASEREPREPVAYLVESRWRIHDVQAGAGMVRYVTQGYGPGEAIWHWPFGAAAEVRWRAASGRTGTLRVDAADRRLLVRLPQLTAERVEVTIERRGGGDAAH